MADVDLQPATGNPMARLRYTDEDGQSFYFKEGVTQVQAENAVKGHKATGILPPYATLQPQLTRWESALDFMNKAGEYVFPTPKTPTEAGLLAASLGLAAIPGGAAATPLIRMAAGTAMRRIGTVMATGALSGALDPGETAMSGAMKGLGMQTVGEGAGYLSNRVTRIIADKTLQRKGTEGAVKWFDDATELLKRKGDPTKSTDTLYRKLYVDATQDAAHEIYQDTLNKVVGLAPKMVQSDYADNLAKLVGYVPPPLMKRGAWQVWRPDDILEMFSLAGRFGFASGAARDTKLANQVIQNRDLLFKQLEHEWPAEAMQIWGTAREQYKTYSAAMKAFQSAGENLFKPDGSLNLEVLRTTVTQQLTPQEREHLGGHLNALFGVFLRGTQKYASRDVPGGWGTNPHFWMGRSMVPGVSLGMPHTPVRVGSTAPELAGRIGRIPASLGFQDILNSAQE